ncbi:TRAP transporter small permease [Nitratireductor sp. StC3]|uniref:TRAP transporter small permease n=1 Tax=Nitratireductor sp. StC3 TaxID=2126741 RepID=UPI001304E320|nr:TRAP transporter small permease [Nitratireductor sp. StC3]
MSSPMPFSFARKAQSLARLLLIGSGGCLLIMIAITVIDVIGRYVFHRSLPGAVELVSFLLAVAVSLSLPAVTLRRGHIMLTLFEGPPTSLRERIRMVVVSLVSAVVAGVLAVLMWRHATEAAEFEDVIGYLELPVAPIVYVFSLTSGAMAAIFLAATLRALGNGEAVDAEAEPAGETPA